MKSDIFEHELSLISDKKLRQFVKDYLDKFVPDYFWTVPASSSGKYHPSYALGEGGLVRHTKACVLFAKELLSLEQNALLCAQWHDEIISALIMHDSFKQGLVTTGHTRFDHPILATKSIMLFAKEYYPEMQERAMEVSTLVMSHMGQWNRKGDIIMPKPITEAEQFVHMCDYLASRKDIIVDVKYEPSKEKEE